MNFLTKHFNSNNDNDSRFIPFEDKTCEPYRFGSRGGGGLLSGEPELSPKSPLVDRRKLYVFIWSKLHFLVLCVRVRVSDVNQKLTLTATETSDTENRSIIQPIVSPTDFRQLRVSGFSDKLVRMFCSRCSGFLGRGTANARRAYEMRHLLASRLGDCRVSQWRRTWLEVTGETSEKH